MNAERVKEMISDAKSLFDEYWRLVESGTPSPELHVSITDSTTVIDESFPCAVFLGVICGRFIEADLRGCDFTQTDTNGLVFERCQLAGASFANDSGARFIRCVFESLTTPLCDELVEGRAISQTPSQVDSHTR